MATKELPIPDFFQSQNAQLRDFRPDVAKLAETARQVVGVTASQADVRRILLLLIDPQMDFCHPGGSLFVGGRSGVGAMQDCVRTAEFIYRNARRLSRIAATLDTHQPFQIFFPEFWLLQTGQVPSAHTLIQQVGGDLCNVGPDGTVIGQVQPNPAITSFVGAPSHDWLVQHANHYVSQLADSGKYALYLWPHHCLQGSDGHRLSGVIEEAMLYHSFLRNVPPQMVEKGEHPLTESYSVFRPEVRFTVDNMPVGPTSDDFIIDVASNYDAVVVAGQASSHCVMSSVQDLVRYCSFVPYRAALIDKFYLLTDCMSPVVVPDGPDFTEQAEEALVEFEQVGMHLVQSTTPIDEWPDFPQTV